MRHIILTLGAALAVSMGAAGEQPGGTTSGEAPVLREAPEWGKRVGYVEGEGTLRVRAGGDEAPWVAVAGDVRSFQLLDWRIAVLSEDGTLRVGEGPLHAPLAVVARNVVAYQLTLSRLGAIQSDGTLVIKEWGFAASPVARGVRAFQITPTRVGVVGLDASFWIQDGGTVSGFRRVASGVRSFQLNGERVAVLGNDGRLRVGQGPARALLLVPQAIAVADFEMEGNDLAVVGTDGLLRTGGGESLPIELAPVNAPRVARVAWAGRKLAALGVDGTLRLVEAPDAGRVQDVSVLAHGVRDFRLTEESRLVLDSAGAGARMLDLAARPAGRRIALTAEGSESSLSVAAGARTGFEVSSANPAHARRAASWEGQRSAAVAEPPVFIEPVLEVRPPEVE